MSKLEQGARGFAQSRLGHLQRQRLQGLSGHLLCYFTISLWNFFCCCPGGSLLSQTCDRRLSSFRSAPPWRVWLHLFYNNSSGSWRLQLNPHCTQHGLLLAPQAQLPRCPRQPPTTLPNLYGALCSFLTTTLCQGAQNSRTPNAVSQLLPWAATWETWTNVSHNSHRIWNMSKVRKTLSFQRCVHYHSEVSTKLPPFYLQGNFLPRLASSKGPVPHLTAQHSSW